ncbi:MAG: hypothetical protein QOH67_406 [Hyphomicrobiales bacterium]|nr:hypothetical protein [Hyphomicrobiales bacterium]
MASIAFKVVDGKVVLVPRGGNPGEPLKVARGATVTWNNLTKEIHHPVAINPPGFITDQIAPDDVSDPGFVATKTITYECSLHPDEKGSIEVA